MCWRRARLKPNLKFEKKKEINEKVRQKGRHNCAFVLSSVINRNAKICIRKWCLLMTTKSHKRIFVFSVVCPYNTRCEQHLEECNKERRTGIAQRQSPSLLIIFIIIIIIYRPIGLDFISFDLFSSSFIRSPFFFLLMSAYLFWSDRVWNNNKKVQFDSAAVCPMARVIDVGGAFQSIAHRNSLFYFSFSAAHDALYTHCVSSLFFPPSYNRHDTFTFFL